MDSSSLPLAACVVVIGLLFALAVLLRRNLHVVTVVGASMEPSLFHGDRVLVRRCGITRVARGDVVVLEADRPLGWPEGRPIVRGSVMTMIKRVAALPGETLPEGLREAPALRAETVVSPDAVVVTGDNVSLARNQDSLRHGAFPARWVTGKVIRKLGAKSMRRSGAVVS
jgi:signal peptidase I